MLTLDRATGVVPLATLFSAILGVLSWNVRAQPCWIGQEYQAPSNRVQWALPNEDPCNCTTVELGGLNMVKSRRPFHMVNHGIPLDLSIFKEQYNCRIDLVCSAPLGMEDGRIANESITASSYYQNKLTHAPVRSRLNTQGYAAGWLNNLNDKSPWIQVDFGVDATITGLITQGRGSSDRNRTDADQWVERYRVVYSSDGRFWNNVTDAARVPEEFIGNADTDDVQVTARFATVVKARYLRILPTHWHKRCCMRFEVIGCSLAETN